MNHDIICLGCHRAREVESRRPGEAKYKRCAHCGTLGITTWFDLADEARVKKAAAAAAVAVSAERKRKRA